MALIRCTGCGHRISSLAKSCPKCGCSAGHPPLDAGSPRIEAPPAYAEPAAEPAAAAAATAFQQDRSAAPPQDKQPESAEEWYYVSASGRAGPVSLASLQVLAAAGKIDPATPVWKAGMLDWIALSRHEEAAEQAIPAEPPPVAEKYTGKASVWVLALAPAWGTILQILATETWVVASGRQLGYYSQWWWIMIAANLAAGCLDAVCLKKSGRDLMIGKWLFLLPPGYLYFRDRRLFGRLIWFWVWLGALLLALAAYLYLNAAYAGLAAG